MLAKIHIFICIVKCSHNFGTKNACMQMSAKKKDVQIFRDCAQSVCVTLSSVLFTLLCSTCDILQGRANRMLVSITSSTHLCTVREDCSGYLSVWEAARIHTCCECVSMLVSDVVVVNVCICMCPGIVKTALTRLCCRANAVFCRERTTDVCQTFMQYSRLMEV